jgi:two-component system cell cycle response regulator CtrA
MLDPLERIRQLEKENAELRDRVELLEEEIGLTAFKPQRRIAGLWRMEMTCIGVLLKNELARTSALMVALYGGDLDSAPSEHVIRVYMCNIRKKLRPYGIEISNVWGYGYKMAEAHKAILRGLMEAA